MISQFELAACTEMIWRGRPIEWRASRLKGMGFGVGLWNWPAPDLSKLVTTDATFTIMNGYLRGRLRDDEGADELLETARETALVGKRLGPQRLNLHGRRSWRRRIACVADRGRDRRDVAQGPRYPPPDRKHGRGR